MDGGKNPQRSFGIGYLSKPTIYNLGLSLTGSAGRFFGELASAMDGFSTPVG